METKHTRPLSELEPLLENEDEDIRYKAAQEIAFDIKPPYEQVCEWGQSESPLRREMAAFILGSSAWTDDAKTVTALTYPQAVPFLLKVLNDTDEDVEQSALEALANHKEPNTLPVILGYADHAWEDLRWSVAFSLGSWDWEGACRQYREEAIRVLVKLMDDTDDDVRDWATFSVHNARLDTPETRARLWKALEDTDCDVRGEAAQGLAKFGDSSFIPVLERMLWEDEDLSPCYFLAAEEFGDPALLPAVIAASERWLAEGHEMTWFIEPTIKALRERGFSVLNDLL
ncbi:hypothetical protein LBMAG21_04180 [Armatimonadota bacterium]|nr:hypothetical protein LBMAG21_04180 [Armatimonadota bacterium]